MSSRICLTSDKVYCLTDSTPCRCLFTSLKDSQNLLFISIMFLQAPYKVCLRIDEHCGQSLSTVWKQHLHLVTTWSCVNSFKPLAARRLMPLKRFMKLIRHQINNIQRRLIQQSFSRSGSVSLFPRQRQSNCPVFSDRSIFTKRRSVRNSNI